MIVLAVLVVLVECYPQAKRDFPQPPYQAAPSYAYQGKPVQPPTYRQQTGGGPAPNGRVKMQVYRGPSKDANTAQTRQDGGSFAPWGFYVTQPEDNLG